MPLDQTSHEAQTDGYDNMLIIHASAEILVLVYGMGSDNNGHSGWMFFMATKWLHPYNAYSHLFFFLGKHTKWVYSAESSWWKLSSLCSKRFLRWASWAQVALFMWYHEISLTMSLLFPECILSPFKGRRQNNVCPFWKYPIANSITVWCNKNHHVSKSVAEMTLTLAALQICNNQPCSEMNDK